ncbi:hypothetical protein KUH03_18645 [Sphingobacterium sp. E70]|uniref:hypothetical protein n=1 Tax=Sphingobacterium sp. E70 TaxID=2853439 RepID=UPI00211B85EF|nr:hypothetical protein [Sphingobacterium sp. E70]ULT28401.1 hypothetical protein KUH03_18645 [Sphingobacterium sp. E70]
MDTISKPDTIEKEVKKENTETLEEVLEKIAKAYTDQDSKTINNYIHPKLGIYIIYRPGHWIRMYIKVVLTFPNQYQNIIRMKN